METSKVSITKQSAHCTTISAAIGSFLTHPETGKNHSNPTEMFGGIVRQLFSETDASEKNLQNYKIVDGNKGILIFVRSI